MFVFGKLYTILRHKTQINAFSSIKHFYTTRKHYGRFFDAACLKLYFVYIGFTFKTMPGLHEKLVHFVAKLLVDLLMITRFTYVTKNNRLFNPIIAFLISVFSLNRIVKERDNQTYCLKQKSTFIYVRRKMVLPHNVAASNS